MLRPEAIDDPQQVVRGGSGVVLVLIRVTGGKGRVDRARVQGDNRAFLEFALCSIAAVRVI